MNALIASLDSIFAKKAPQLPAGVKEFIVKVAPYVVIIGLIFTAFSLVSLLLLILGGGALFAYAAVRGAMTNLVISLILFIVIGVLEAMAVSGLFHRRAHSWKLMFYAQLVSLLSLLLSLNIVGFIFGGIIGFYILFQVRSRYTDMASMGQEGATPTSAPAA